MLFLTFLLGLVFGLGLLLSGMTDPAKVIAFLDVAGRWDPSLALVMLGAIGVAIGPFQLAGRHRDQSVRQVDRPMLLGSALFGIGWGLGGFCPGPALLGLAAGYFPAAIFVLAMLLGMEIYQWLGESRVPHSASENSA